MLTFVVATKSPEILKGNFLASAELTKPHQHQLIIQQGFSSAAVAYNDAIEKSENDLMIFAHQDIYLPGSWVSQLEGALELLRERDPNWGVIGCYGNTVDGNFHGYLYSSAQGIHGKPFAMPARVQT